MSGQPLTHYLDPRQRYPFLPTPASYPPLFDRICPIVSGRGGTVFQEHFAVLTTYNPQELEPWCCLTQSVNLVLLRATGWTDSENVGTQRQGS